jgi:NAD(P)-dependent dehydrogenase (short-subunit alcohol dehydrogenase family)
MHLDLSGKTALVSGASRGIGRAISLALAESGADLILLSRGKEDLEQLAAEIKSFGHKAHPVACDVFDTSSIAQALIPFPNLEVAVINAGTNLPEPFLDVSEEHYDRIMNLNVKAAFFTAQQAVRRMTKGGSVIFITSQMGHVGAPNRTVYCASKHALEGLVKALAVELAPQGIRINSVAPTFVETDLTRPMLADPAFGQSVLSRIPLGQLGQPRDVAAAVVFLASSASSLITGTSLLVDGGWTAQ